ncbi:hypothetical protein [Pusillimonas noertemannii]|nr:hypothetical protein [Pusillimonas noertemannii]NYT68748.1 hypothetical protein [Pusillimonas noertemannii]TFL10789.1 hypothetical protein CSC72_09745 [Pusillimonas noertemannii]
MVYLDGAMMIPLLRGIAMWKCMHCGLEVMFQAVEPEVDNDGCHFICPGCEGRNPLANVSGNDSIVLAQPD